MGLTKEQLALRRTGITASEISVVAGLSTRKSVFAIWREKTEGESVEAEEEHGPGYAHGVRTRGNFLERGVLDWWEAQRAPAPRSMTYAADIGTLISERNPLLMATPDALALMELGAALEPVEAKTSRLMEGWGIAGTDVVPMEYRAQVMLQMEAVRAERAHIAVYFPMFDEFREYHVAFDADFFGLLAEAAQRFWRDYVVTRRPPPADYSKDEMTDWLKRRFPSETGDRKALRAATPDEERMALRLQRIDNLRNRLDPMSKELTARIKEGIGEESGLVFSNGTKATWLKNTDAEAVNWSAAAWYLRTIHVEGRITDEQWSAALILNTRAKVGARVFRKSWSRQQKKSNPKGEQTDE